MSSFRILITGGNGFVGRHFAAALAELEDLDVVVGSYAGNGASPGAGASVALDVTDADQVLSVIRTVRPTHVVHLAAIAAPSVAQRFVRKTWEVNFGGTMNVALALTEAAPDCRMIFCSSAEIYGDSFRSGTPLDERAALDPTNVYGVAKAAADLLVGQMAKRGLKAVRLRPFNHTGPGQSEDFVIPSFAAQIARIERHEQEPVIQVGNLTGRRDFLDVRDVVRAYVDVILRFDEFPSGSVFNVSSGRAIAIGEMLDYLVSLASRKITIRQDPTRFREGEIAEVVGNSDALRQALNWAPRFELPATLASVLDYFRKPASAKSA